MTHLHLLFLFLDGVGLGAPDPQYNPWEAAALPHLRALLGGHSLSAAHPRLETRRASLQPLDAALGIPGRPQSASGQAAILTGRNIPLLLGSHYGPRPNPPIAAALRADSLFHRLQRLGLRADLCNAYPPPYFEALRRGKRIPGAVAMAAQAAGLPLHTRADLLAGQALSADFTAAAWREYFEDPQVPLLSPRQAGMRLAGLAQRRHFTFFEYWLSDVAGHRRERRAALRLLDDLDGVLEGLLAAWDFRHGLIVLTSDHGNLEDLRIRQHTRNPVPLLLIGSPTLRARFRRFALQNLCHLAPAIQYFLSMR